MELVALGLTVLVHFLGLGALVYVLLQGENVDWRSWWPGDDDDGPDEPSPLGPPPLPDAAPSRARLREPGRLADAYPPPARRPAHAPAPAREREPA